MGDTEHGEVGDWRVLRTETEVPESVTVLALRTEAPRRAEPERTREPDQSRRPDSKLELRD